MVFLEGMHVWFDLDQPWTADAAGRFVMAIDAWIEKDRAATRDAACPHRLCQAYRSACFGGTPHGTTL